MCVSGVCPRYILNDEPPVPNEFAEALLNVCAVCGRNLTAFVSAETNVCNDCGVILTELAAPLTHV